jgi:cellulose synthase/poly-beta-1,6-N-acetylglucosamine synthase-like glycosyltransferase
MNVDQTECPKVTVIAPVYNDQQRIGILIDSLLNQDYPRDRYEVIIVDNGSTDQSPARIKKYEGIVFLEEHDVQSSYAARNKGIAHAAGEILAFIDSDCMADPQWIREGVDAILKNNADFAGGKVEFFFSAKQTVFGMYDSMTSMQNQLYVKHMGASTTSNLFVRSRLFQETGLFPSVKSGGDMQWTRAATQKGYKIIYAEKAVVKHPARDWPDLLKKCLRVGKGYPQIWDKFKKPLSHRYEVIKEKLLPPPRSTIKDLIKERAPGKGYEKEAVKIWMVAYLCNLTTVLGILLFWQNRSTGKEK